MAILGTQAFRKLNGESRLEAFSVSNITANAGDAYMWSRTLHTLVAATSSAAQTDQFYIADGPIVSSETSHLFHRVDNTQEWIAQTTNAANATHNGQRMVFGANNTVINNTGTDSASGVFVQTGVAAYFGTNFIYGKFMVA